jgi:tRNA A-37 threonylcarbamoyl transferase component Bud32
MPESHSDSSDPNPGSPAPATPESGASLARAPMAITPMVPGSVLGSGPTAAATSSSAGLQLAGVKIWNGDLAPGTILGDWRVEHRIGAGGMGTVYSAVHRIIGKRAAIKVVRTELCTSPLTGERFVQEARVVNQIGHPNIVDIFHIGTLEDGRPFLVMELLTGRTLAERMAQGRLPPTEIIDVLLQMCGALGAAHTRGVIHRDLKPDNVFLAEGQGRIHVKLLDWGIAKLMDDTALAATLTTTGMIVGTPQYVSPEQARGKHVDHRTDIYSLGTIAYELFLEGPPFVADSVADLVAMHLREPPMPPSELWPDVPVELEALLLSMLAKDPAERPSLHEVATALLRIRHELVSRAFGARRGASGAWGNGRLAAGSTPPPMAFERHPTLPATAPSGSIDIASLVAAATHTPAPWPYGLDNQARRARRATMERNTGGVAVRPARWTYVSVAVSLAALAGVATLLLREPETRLDAAVALPLAAMPAAAPAEAVVAPALAAEPPAAVVGALDIRIAPHHARIRIDGVDVAASDGRAVREVAGGAHEVQVDAVGFAPYRRTIDVAAGTVVLDVTLRPAAGRRRERERELRRRPAPGVNPDGTIDPFQ